MIFDIWKDQILLWWDGHLPLGANPQHLSLYKERPDILLQFWKTISPYTRWSKKLSCFILSFSAQNLQRIRTQFPNAKVQKGESRIKELRQRWQEFQEVRTLASDIKDLPILPEYKYKVKPLAEYQHIGTVLLTETRSVPLFADCGVGKSYMVLASTEQQISKGLVPSGRTLVCAKLMTIASGWMKDCEKFTNLKAANLWLPQSPKRKERFLDVLHNSGADIFIINHDGVRVFEEELAAMRFEKVVVDESTILKSFHGTSLKIHGGQFGRALLRVAEHAKWRVIMSGTPAPNGIEDLWGQFYFLDPNGFLLEKHINDFRETFMEAIVFGNPNDKTAPRKWVPKPGGIEAVSALIDPISYRVRIRDHIKDLPERTLINREISMSPLQAKHYAEMEDALCTVIEDSTITADVKLAQLMKLRQITGGFIIDHQEAAHAIEPNPKLEMLDQLVEEEIAQDCKIVIYAQYRWEIETIASRYKNCVTVYGGNTATTNISNINSFIENPDVRIIVLHPKSAAHGITFTVAHYMIFYSISYSAEDDYQCIARIERAGQKEAMFVYYLLAESSIDGVIHSVIRRKSANQAKLIDQAEIESEILEGYRAKISGQSSVVSKPVLRKTRRVRNTVDVPT